MPPMKPMTEASVNYGGAGRSHPLSRIMKPEVTMEDNAIKFAASRAAKRLGAKFAVADPAGTMKRMYEALYGRKLEKAGPGPGPGATSSEAKDGGDKEKSKKKDKDKKKKDKKKKDKKKEKKAKSKKKKAKASSSSSSSESSSSGQAAKVGNQAAKAVNHRGETCLAGDC
ncbi:unnamed protein product [Polarella glacialis]|uniref:Uncharacterized protein n=1 Tax=Polarella glacialis TaxID=89957 RepID=A0A813HNV5_POLGL|nr:unnamed protein product [Polarella glacialis]